MNEKKLRMNKQGIEVYKFGGISIGSVDSVKQVADLIKSNNNKNLVVVFSAIGKTTRKLVNLIKAAYAEQKEAEWHLKNIQYNLNSIIEGLNLVESTQQNILYQKLQNSFKQSLKKTSLSFPEYYDQVIVYGELISSAIMSIYLESEHIENKWVDITGIIKTDSNFCNANVDFYESANKIKKVYKTKIKSEIIITQGFIGSDKNGRRTSLGFEGSDYSAALIGNALDAEKVTLWKDVEGVMDDDPKINPEARVINNLTFEEANHLLLKGAKIIHPKTIEPLRVKNIPLQVRSYLDPESKGTLVFGQPSLDIS